MNGSTEQQKCKRIWGGSFRSNRRTFFCSKGSFKPLFGDVLCRYVWAELIVYLNWLEKVEIELIELKLTRYQLRSLDFGETSLVLVGQLWLPFHLLVSV